MLQGHTPKKKFDSDREEEERRARPEKVYGGADETSGQSFLRQTMTPIG